MSSEGGYTLPVVFHCNGQHYILSCHKVGESCEHQIRRLGHPADKQTILKGEFKHRHAKKKQKKLISVTGCLWQSSLKAFLFRKNVKRSKRQTVKQKRLPNNW